MFTPKISTKSGPLPELDLQIRLQLEEESDFLHAAAIQAVAIQAASGQKFQSDLRRKQTFVIFNDCQHMLQNVDKIIISSIITGVFKWTLTNIEVCFILQRFLKL